MKVRETWCKPLHAWMDFFQYEWNMEPTSSCLKTDPEHGSWSNSDHSSLGLSFVFILLFLSCHSWTFLLLFFRGPHISRGEGSPTEESYGRRCVFMSLFHLELQTVFSHLHPPPSFVSVASRYSVDCACDCCLEWTKACAVICPDVMHFDLALHSISWRGQFPSPLPPGQKSCTSVNPELVTKEYCTCTYKTQTRLRTSTTVLNCNCTCMV